MDAGYETGTQLCTAITALSLSPILLWACRRALSLWALDAGSLPPKAWSGHSDASLESARYSTPTGPGQGARPRPGRGGLGDDHVTRELGQLAHLDLCPLAVRAVRRNERLGELR